MGVFSEHSVDSGNVRCLRTAHVRHRRTDEEATSIAEHLLRDTRYDQL